MKRDEIRIFAINTPKNIMEFLSLDSSPSPPSISSISTTFSAGVS
jgi:hypothetical protein